MMDRAIVSNWHQNLDDKLIRECVGFKINISWILDVSKKLYLKEPKDAYRYKEKMWRRDGKSTF